MEEEGESGSWLKWLIIIPVCMAAGAFLTKWTLQSLRGARPAPVQAVAPAVPYAARQAPAPAAPDNSGYDLPGDEPAGGEAAVVWSNKPSSAAEQAARSAAPAAGPKEEKNYHAMGLAYGALSKAAAKLLDNPKAVSALLNNDYVVKGFMARDTVKAATANAASLSAYLKNPANVSQFMGKPAVRGGMNDRDLVNALASSKLAGALMDTPGGKALLNDPASIADIVKSDPALLGVLTNPAVLNALMQNPKTAGIVANINMAGAGR